jgi:hypothetical protein
MTTDAGSGSALIALDSPDDQADHPEDLDEFDDLPAIVGVFGAHLAAPAAAS